MIIFSDYFASAKSDLSACISPIFRGKTNMLPTTTYAHYIKVVKIDKKTDYF